jgi:hypothetical protein
MVCSSCGCGAVRLFARHGTYACRHCHKALYASQRQDSKGRKRFQACKLRLEVGGLPDIDEGFPVKAKWLHRKTYQRLRSQAQQLETAIKSKRFRKPIDTRIFAYYLAG